MTKAGTRRAFLSFVAALALSCASKDELAPHGGAGMPGSGGLAAAGTGGSATAGAGGTGGGAGSASGSGGSSGASAGSGSATAGQPGVAGAGGASGAAGGAVAGASSGAGGLVDMAGAAGEALVAGAPSAGSGAAGAPAGPPKIVLVAGTGMGDDGSPATSAAVLNPYGTVVDPITGDIYIAEVDTGKIRHIDASGIISTVVGPGAPGSAASIVLNQPHDLLFQPGTRILFIADTMNGNVYRLDAASGDVAMFVGPNGMFPGLSIVYCLAFSASGTDLYYTGPNDIRVVDLEAEAAKPAVPYAAARVIAIDSKDKLYAVKNRPNGDSLDVVDAAGMVTKMPATVNVVSDPKHITIDTDDNVLLADTELFYLRRYDVKGDTLETLVGNGVSGTGTLGGDPKNAQLKRPHGVFEDKKTGEIYISDSENNRVLKITR